MKSLRFLLMAALVVLAFSCKGQNEGISPEPIYLGEEICSRCGMIISDVNYAAQLIEPGKGAHKFDDIGCLVEFMQESGGGEQAIGKAFVMAQDKGEWLPFEDAHFVRSDKIKTPMGHGIMAFSDYSEAKSFAASVHGNILKSQGLLLTEDPGREAVNSE